MVYLGKGKQQYKSPHQNYKSPAFQLCDEKNTWQTQSLLNLICSKSERWISCTKGHLTVFFFKKRQAFLAFDDVVNAFEIKWNNTKALVIL